LYDRCWEKSNLCHCLQKPGSLHAKMPRMLSGEHRVGPLRGSREQICLDGKRRRK
jgi:hypothetical protein